jgi:L-lactate dehydrogenase complex protein LldE
VQVSLFVTCLVNVYFPEAAADAVRLLRSLGVEVSFPAGQTCCGQPPFNAGQVSAAAEMAAYTRRALRDSRHVVVPSGSCTAMMRRFYPRILQDGPHRRPAGGDAPGAEASCWGDTRVWELAEFLTHVLQVETLGSGLAGLRVAYHHGCHALRELGLRGEALQLLTGAGAEVVSWEAAEECCGFGGLFSVKLPEVSVAMADRKLDTLLEAEPDLLTSADGGCLLQLAGRMSARGLQVPVVPLATLLWRARSTLPRADASRARPDAALSRVRDDGFA